MSGAGRNDLEDDPSGFAADATRQASDDGARGLAAIEAALRLTEHGQIKGPDLGTGAAGVALFNALLAFCTGEVGPARQAAKLISEAVKHRGRVPLRLSFYQGIPGILWVANCLEGLNVCGVPRRALQETDEMVRASLRNWRGEDELLHGLAGLRVYAAGHRSPTMRVTLQAEVTAALLRRRESRSKIAMTTTPIRQDPGVAHGQSGVVAAIAESDEGCWGSELRGSLEASICSLLNDETRATEAFRKGLPSLSWCHGILGTATVLSRAGVAMRSDRILAATRSLALRACEAPATEVQGLSLCHGLAGAALMSSLLAGMFAHDSIAAKASECWDDLMRAMRSRKPHQAARSAPLGVGFLDGAAGVGLGLLFRTFGLAPGWMECMSLPRPHDAPPGQKEATV